MKRKILVSVALTLIGVGAAVGVARVVRADTATTVVPHSSGQASWDEQNRLDDFYSWILARPGIGSSGYLTSVNDSDTGSTVLLWHGPANSMQQQIKDKAAELGITVTVEQRDYSLDDINRAAEKVEERSGKEGALRNFKVNEAGGITADFDGLVIVGTYLGPITGSRAEADAALAKAASNELGIAVKIEHGGGAAPL